jgi:hypothetical protein
MAKRLEHIKQAAGVAHRRSYDDNGCHAEMHAGRWQMADDRYDVVVAGIFNKLRLICNSMERS